VTNLDRCAARSMIGPLNKADTHLRETQGGVFQSQAIQFRQVNDIYAMGFSECYIERLEQYQARAYIILPIFQDGQLWGLLSVFQNSGPRQWEESEVNLLCRMVTQLEDAVKLARYTQQVQAQTQQISQLAEQEKSAKEQLQTRALRLLQAVEPAFQGDLTVRAPLTEDEVGTIADGYNTMLQTLRELVTRVKIVASRVGQTSETSSHAVAQLSQQAQEQYQELSRALSELRQMIELIEVVAQEAAQVEQAVLSANQTVQSGDAVMEQTVEGIVGIRETVSETAQKIKSLGESSQKISRVVSLIDNFANQTNLLAINAAIEATRAGDYGRGFAVVADEIRSLAYQSANATTEIERLVQEIQTETQAVTEVMEVGIMQVVQGTDLVNQTRQSLTEIKTATAQISERVQRITFSTSTQSMQSALVTNAMQVVAEIANKTSSDSVTIATYFDQLLETSQELQTSVRQFKVD
jgi:methyl-accepting chemotaxis protein PixJ